MDAAFRAGGPQPAGCQKAGEGGERKRKMLEKTDYFLYSLFLSLPL